MSVHKTAINHHRIIRDVWSRVDEKSIVLQALVDYEYKFMNIYVGWPGSVHDARVLAHSVVFDKRRDW